MATNKLLIIALDGGTFNVLRPLAKECRLQNIGRIIEEGVCGDLESVIPPVTGPAWATFMTGKNPGKHSVYEFVKKTPDGSDYPINSSEIKGRALWEILSDAGKHVVVINVPVTYPPRKVNGVLLADFLTPVGRKDFGYPGDVVDELEERFGPYRLYISEVYAPGRVGKVLDELFEVLEYRVKTAKHLMKTRRWDLFMVHIWGTDRLQHELWHILDTTHPKHNRDEAAKYRDRVVQYYQKVDEAIGELTDLAGEKADIMVISDHGFGPIEKFMSFNVWLMKENLLRIKRTPLSLVKYALFKLGVTPTLGYRLSLLFGFAKLRLHKGVAGRIGLFALVNRFFLSLRDVDWSNTLAYSKGNYGQIFLNLRGREPGGIVEPGEQAETVMENIISRLRNITDPMTGEKLIGRIYRASELYSGPYSGEAPDITFLPADMRYKAIGSVDLTTNRFLTPVYGNFGDHRMEGIFLGLGPSFKKRTTISGARLMDIAPTVLHIMGEKVPVDMDGEVLTGLIDDGLAASRPVEYSEVREAADQENAEFDEAENEEIRKRLKDLGYMA